MKWMVPLLLMMSLQSAFAEARYFARFSYDNQVRYGQVLGDRIQPLAGNILSNIQGNASAELLTAASSIALADVTLLLPSDARQVFAVGMNFASHIPSPSSAPPPMFLKLPTSLIVSGKPVVLPEDADNVHFEGELVLVIGKRVKNISEAEAADAIFGVTVGNDLTERSWQGSDLQWMRAKASDGFGPVSPIIARDVDYNNLLLTTKLNGVVVQQENTSHMIHKPAKVVSYLSRYFTLSPGDLIFMGTPGRTKALQRGDVVSVSIDQIGTVENTIQ